jgi:CDP-paratose 2-epimerase
MKYRSILITGGAGFVGSTLALYLQSTFPDTHIICLDNLKRRGSELNLARLQRQGIEFVHGDIRCSEDLADISFDLMIECSAEPSVLAGVTNSPAYLLNTNLVGTLHCLEAVRKNKADLIFLSTSRVYPIEAINAHSYLETQTRFTPSSSSFGFSEHGISEQFPLAGPRSLYGTTKLCSELVIQEYIETYGISAVINRCGLLSGPYQMGKVDQGVIVLWVFAHLFGKPLSYTGYGGKQVRDVLHIDDLCTLIEMQIRDLSRYHNQIFNVGGGDQNSISLLELTEICKQVTGCEIDIPCAEGRPNDLIWYVTDNSKITEVSGWKPQKSVFETISDVTTWIQAHEHDLIRILG